MKYVVKVGNKYVISARYGCVVSLTKLLSRAAIFHTVADAKHCIKYYHSDGVVAKIMLTEAA